MYIIYHKCYYTVHTLWSTKWSTYHKSSHLVRSKRRIFLGFLWLRICLHLRYTLRYHGDEFLEYRGSFGDYFEGWKRSRRENERRRSGQWRLKWIFEDSWASTRWREFWWRTDSTTISSCHGLAAKRRRGKIFVFIFENYRFKSIFIWGSFHSNWDMKFWKSNLLNENKFLINW